MVSEDLTGVWNTPVQQLLQSSVMCIIHVQHAYTTWILRNIAAYRFSVWHRSARCLWCTN